MEGTTNEITDVFLILSTSRALLSEIRPNMRRVSIDYDRELGTISLLIYYDKPLNRNELDEDVSGIIVAEISADFPQNIDWKDDVIICPYPNKIPDKGLCVFQRYEPSLSLVASDESVHEGIYSEINNVSLLLSANQALLNEVRPDMRRVSVNFDRDQNEITVSFYLNKLFADSELCVANVLRQMSSWFSLNVHWKDEVIVLPFPIRIPDKGGFSVFQRYEPYPIPS